MTSRILTTFGLVAALALAGCGAPALAPSAPTAALDATAPAPVAAPVLVAPIESAPEAARETVESAPQIEAPQRSVIRIVGETDMSFEEMALDADEAGYTVQSEITLPGTTGTIRRGENNTYMLEASQDHLGVRRNVIYRLSTSDMTLHTWFGAHVNEKALVRGFFKADNTVQVSYAKKLTSFAFLTNWFTKGKVVGTVTDYAKVPVRSVEVKVRNSKGFVFTHTTSEIGAFSLKNLPPDTYALSISKYGYQPASLSVTVKQRKSLKLELLIAKSTGY